MAYIQVEASVRTHKKFLKAGPAASWLWLCGMGYCQDGLTDGFIPFEAIDYLGIKGTTARKLKCVLVDVGLWENCDGGWQVHDYLQHNKSADQIQRTKATRAAGGIKGGRPTKKPSTETLEVTGKVNHTENPSHLISATATATPTATAPRGPATLVQRRRLDAAFEGPRVYVPQRIHSDFLAFRNGNERELLTWYADVSEEWATGQRRNDATGADMFAFWRARFDEKWPAAKPKTMDQGPAYLKVQA